MLVSALIHREMDEACKKVKGMSIYDCLLDAMFVKIAKDSGQWKIRNLTPKQVNLFQQLGTPTAMDF